MNSAAFTKARAELREACADLEAIRPYVNTGADCPPVFTDAWATAMALAQKAAEAYAAACK